MSDALRKRLIDAVPILSDRLTAAAERLLALRSEDPAFRELDGPMLLGLARAISTHSETAGFLSHLVLAHVRVPETPSFAVIGMGKLAGMEFTYHSDLDLIFLTEGGAEAVHEASRIGQRLISYLATMTGAGVAYSVDTRLRPSGRQGTLVTTFSAFERYQCERAQTWEHLAMLRARPVAGATESAQATLDRVRESVLPGRAPQAS